jgi:hypothetical protein
MTANRSLSRPGKRCAAVAEEHQSMSGPNDRRDFSEAKPVNPPKDLGDDAAVRFLLPVGRSGWAIASGYLGLISILCFPAPFAILTGILAIREMRRNPKKHGMGRAIFGIIMGSIGTVGLIFVLFALLVSPLTKR